MKVKLTFGCELTTSVTPARKVVSGIMEGVEESTQDLPVASQCIFHDYDDEDRQLVVSEYCVPTHIIHIESSNTRATFLISELMQTDKMMQKLCRC